jgi:hypothetical protein
MTASTESVKNNFGSLATFIDQSEPVFRRASGRISRADRSGVVICIQKFEAVTSAALSALSQKADGVARETMEQQSFAVKKALNTLKTLEAHRGTIEIYDERKVSFFGKLWYKVLRVFGNCFGGKIYVALNQTPLTSAALQKAVSEIDGRIASSAYTEAGVPSSAPSSPESSLITGRILGPTELEPDLPEVTRNGLKIQARWNIKSENVLRYFDDEDKRGRIREGEEVLQVFASVTKIPIQINRTSDDTIEAVFTAADEHQVALLRELVQYVWTDPRKLQGHGYFKVLVDLLVSGHFDPTRRPEAAAKDACEVESRIMEAAWHRFEETAQIDEDAGVQGDVGKVGDFIIAEVESRLGESRRLDREEKKNEAARVVQSCVIYDRVHDRVLAEMRYQRPKSHWLSVDFHSILYIMRDLQPQELKDIILADCERDQRIPRAKIPSERWVEVRDDLVARANKDKLYWYFRGNGKQLSRSRRAQISRCFTPEEKKAIFMADLCGPQRMSYWDIPRDWRKELFQGLVQNAPIKAHEFLRQLTNAGAAVYMRDVVQTMPESPLRDELLQLCTDQLRAAERRVPFS